MGRLQDVGGHGGAALLLPLPPLLQVLYCAVLYCTVLYCTVLYCTVLLSRCTRSVSYPAPTYYSHLAADRARKHHDHLTEKERKSQEAAKKILEEEGSKANLMYFV